MTSCVSHVHSYLLENSETEDEPEQFEYKWTKEIELKRSLDAANSLKKKIINHLLQRATLYKIEPFVYSTVKFEPDERLQYCESFIEALNDHNKLYPVQEIIWPYIKSGRPSILIGKTDFYPHLLYLPPILNLVKVNQKIENSDVGFYTFFYHCLLYCTSRCWKIQQSPESMDQKW